MLVLVCHTSYLNRRKTHVSTQLNLTNTWNNVHFIENESVDEWRDKFVTLSDPQISRFMKQIECLRVVASADGDTLILEDDAFFKDNVVGKFNEFKRQLPDNWGVGFLGGTNTSTNNGNLIYTSAVRVDGKYANSTDFYIISKRYAQMLLDEFNSDLYIKDSYPYWLRAMNRKYDAVALEAQPPLGFDGSKCGLFDSSI